MAEDTCSMVDYKTLGSRIRAVRLEKKMTQEQLAEAVGVGVTHISHIETGNSIPSLQVMLDIINALGCSADELFCMEIDQARPLMNSWLSELVADCSNMEIKLITDMVLSLKSSLRRLRLDDPT
nr:MULTISPECIES: helix-turn-helix transcriptional regulator [Oscillospiraceae]